MQVNPDLHLTYSKNGANQGLKLLIYNMKSYILGIRYY